jgi:hypothetical protein
MNSINAFFVQINKRVFNLKAETKKSNKAKKKKSWHSNQDACEPFS